MSINGSPVDSYSPLPFRHAGHRLGSPAHFAPLPSQGFHQAPAQAQDTAMESTQVHGISGKAGFWAMADTPTTYPERAPPNPSRNVSNKSTFSEDIANRIARLPEIDVPLANRLSQDSVTSDFSSATSLYPQSSVFSSSASTVSQSPSLHTPPSYFSPGHYGFEAKVQDSELHNTDDVAYRLRLLVNNSYFLPPAHSKPSPADLAPSSPKKREQTSGFLDLFRRSRSRSKSTTPTPRSPNLDISPPILRTTSDSIITVNPVSRPSNASSTGPLYPSSALPDRIHRVAVVREQMDDIAVAARLAEQDLKNRGPVEPTAFSEMLLTCIDPTDVVDVPPPSSTYPFAVQASEFCGLGVDQSLGADVLADRLLSSNASAMMSLNTPEMNTSEREEMQWRRKLLQEAVSNSLNNTPRHSSAPTTSLNNTPRHSSAPATPLEIPPIAYKIIEHPVIDSDCASASDVSARRPTSSRRSAHKPPPIDPRFSLHHQRVDSPSEPQTPLPPPPRRRIINPVFSVSQPDVSQISSSTKTRGRASSKSSHRVKKATSSPTLADDRESRAGAFMTPPPVPDFRLSAESRATSSSDFQSGAVSLEIPRSSSSLSIATDHQSAHSTRSLATSAFYDARESVASLPFNRSTISLHERVPQPVVPPPRTSSHFARPPSAFSRKGDALLPIAIPPRAPPSIPSRSSASYEGETRVSRGQPPILQIFEPEPATPPFPLTASERSQQLASSSRPTLNTSISRPSVELRSAPPTVTPSSFFDDMESQPNAMDDLDSSDEEDDHQGGNGDSSSFSAVYHTTNISRATVHSIHSTHSYASTSKIEPPPSRRSFMRFGNHSSPHVSRSPYFSDLEKAPPVPSRRSTDKQPIGFVPPKKGFFRERKTSTPASGVGPLQSTFDLYQYTQQIPAAAAFDPEPSSLLNVPRRRPATTEGAVKASRSPSMRKLDGLVMQHMEAEKDTIKRITDKQVKVTAKSSRFKY